MDWHYSPIRRNPSPSTSSSSRITMMTDMPGTMRYFGANLPFSFPFSSLSFTFAPMLEPKIFKQSIPTNLQLARNSNREAARPQQDVEVGGTDDAALERKVVSKLDRNLVPLVFALCSSIPSLLLEELTLRSDLLSYLDRSNVGSVTVLLSSYVEYLG